ncbi:MAG: ABC transporter permease [Candidatus Poseidoniaceae archaeon]|nr:ABC transporter permease [Candidatus Poseidoniaceae archaeon]
MFASVGSNQFTFGWEWNSLFSGAVWGFLLAIATVWFSALWTSRMNILIALKGGRVPRSEGIPMLLVLLQICSLGAGILTLGLLLIFGFSSSVSYFLWMVTGVAFVFFSVPLVTWELPLSLRGRSRFWKQLWRHSNRNTLATIGFSLLIWTVGLSSIDPVRAAMEPDELSFIVLGLVDVLAGVLLLTSAAPLVVSRLGKSKILTQKWGPVLPVSLAYPLSTPVRTAVVMGMFSITVFSVIVLGGYAEQFDNYTSSFVEEAEGDYELLLTGSRSSPIVLSSNVSDWNLSEEMAGQIDSIAHIHRGEVFLEDAGGERMPYVLRGFDENFSSHGGLPLYTWDSALGDEEKEVWATIASRDDLVILDASFGLESIADGSGISMLSFSIGDSISLIDISNPGNTRNVQVAGFLEQSSYLFSAGVWMNEDAVIEQFDGRLTRMYVSISEDAVPSQSFEDEQIIDFSPTGKSRDVRLAAAQLESELTPTLNAKGVQVSVISDEVMLIQSLVLALLGIFEGYLALGLIVGIAGIGVVTVRSVSERSKSIGILRALGYRKSMVFLSFFIEVSWVSVLGMINGILVAVGFHRVLYTSFWKDQGASFTMPVQSMMYVFIGGWLLVLLATYAPIRRAASIPASAALRQN